MKTYYSDPTANAAIANLTREEERAKKKLRKKETVIWRPDPKKATKKHAKKVG